MYVCFSSPGLHNLFYLSYSLVCPVSSAKNAHIWLRYMQDTQREDHACICHAATEQEQGSTVDLLKAARLSAISKRCTYLAEIYARHTA